MAETVAQLIARGQVVYDETVDGANTHERIGEAFIQNASLQGEPIEMPYVNILSDFQIAWALSLCEPLLITSPAWRSLPLRFACFGWPYKSGAGIPANNTGYAPFFLSDPFTTQDAISFHMFAEAQAQFGSLSAANGQYFWIQPALVDQFGRTIKYQPRAAIILDEL